MVEEKFTSQKIESRHFYSCPPGKLFPKVLIITPKVERNYSSSRAADFENLLPPAGRNYASFVRTMLSQDNSLTSITLVRKVSKYSSPRKNGRPIAFKELVFEIYKNHIIFKSI